VSSFSLNHKFVYFMLADGWQFHRQALPDWVRHGTAATIKPDQVDKA